MNWRTRLFRGPPQRPPPRAPPAPSPPPVDDAAIALYEARLQRINKRLASL